MRVLFVYPALDCPPGVSHGLASLAGVLKARGHETALIHVTEALPPVPTPADVVARVQAWRPGLLAFSAMTQQYAWAKECARAVRAASPGLPVVVGGVHCTMVPDQVVRDGLAEGLWDYVCVGEGELALAELADGLARGERPVRVPNLRVLSGGREVRNAVAPFPDLEALPPPDWGLFDLERITARKDGWVSLLTGRGCPYQCTYCFNAEVVRLYRAEGALKHGREYLRRYPIERVLGELAGIRARLPGVRTVIFDDDLFTLDKPYVLEFCRRFAEAGVGLPFVVNAHVQTFDGEMAGALAAAGCRIVKFGLESGSARVRREVLRRFMSNERIAAAFAAAHAAGLHTSAFIMAGLPTETAAELLETLDLCARLEVGRFRWALFYPFPGTAAHALAVRLGLIDEERWRAMGNYFGGSCLRLGPELDLLLEKVAALCHWWVNARTPWPAAARYAGLCAEVEALGAAAFRDARPALLARDQALSEELMAQGTRHYSRCFSDVMGVRSDYVLAERNAAARTRRGE